MKNLVVKIVLAVARMATKLVTTAMTKFHPSVDLRARGHLEIVRFLVDRGANIHTSGSTGEGSHLEMARLLLNQE